MANFPPYMAARCKAESKYPKLWPDFAWVPSLNPRGIATLYERTGKCTHATLINFTLANAWDIVAGIPCLTSTGSSQTSSFPVTNLQTPNVMVSLWLYRNGNFGVFAFPVGISDAGNNGWRFYGSGSSLLFSYNAYNDAATQVSVTIPNLTWTHIYATFDGATLACTARYAGGSSTASKASATAISYTSTTGAMFNRSGWGGFAGSIADVAIGSQVPPAQVGQKLFELGPGGIFEPETRQVVTAQQAAYQAWWRQHHQQQIIGGGLGV